MTKYIFLFPKQTINLELITRKPSCRNMPTAHLTSNLFPPENHLLNYHLPKNQLPKVFTTSRVKIKFFEGFLNKIHL